MTNAKQIASMRLKTTKLKKISQKQGYIIISSTIRLQPKSTKNKNYYYFLLECISCHHRWSAEFGNLFFQRTRCPECHGGIKVSNGIHKTKLTIEKINEKLAKFGIICLSQNYLNNHMPLKWCCQNNHVWTSTYGHINKKKGCPKCYHKTVVDKNLKKYEEKLTKFSLAKGFELLEPYKGRIKYHNFKCTGCGNVISTSFHNIIKNPKGCRICSRKASPTKEHIEQTLSKVGFSIAPEWQGYVNAKTKIPIIHNNCGFRHYRSWDYIVSQIRLKRILTGCSNCNKLLGERIVRRYFELLFNCEFPKIRPDWLRNPNTKFTLELDGFNEQLKIAFEYNGSQHYHIVNKFHTPKETVEKTKFKDKLKEEACKKRGITLVIIPELISMLPLEKFDMLLKEQLKNKDIDWTKAPKIKEIYFEIVKFKKDCSNKT